MASGLLEREGEVTAIAAAALAVTNGAGRLVLIEGPAGIGKTALLESAAEREVAFTALRARGGELERSLPYGIVRQLFERRGMREPELLEGAARLATSALSADAGEAPGELFAILHGLYWLCSNLAERSPLLLVVDDVHWGDEPSLRFLHHLARRLADIPVLVLAALRSDEPDAQVALLDALRADAAAVLRPQPLSLAATRALLGEVWQSAADAVHEATGGNPFLVGELARSLAEGEPPDRTPRSIAESLQRKLAGLNRDACALAEAVAVLGAEAQPRQAGAIAGLDQAQALAAADALISVGVLADGLPLRFVHPLVRTALHEAIPAGRRAGLHHAAARVLDNEPESDDQLATHLLQTPPGADAWAAERLARAASSSLARGAPSAAVQFAGRALAEPPPQAARFDVLSTLGQAEVRLGRMEGIEHLREAMTLTSDVERRVLVVRDIALQLVHAGQIGEACSLLRGALGELDAGDREPRLWLEGDLVAYAVLHPTLVAEGRDRLSALAPGLAGSSPAERYVLATYSLLQATADEAARIAEVALSHPEDLEQPIVGSAKLVRPRRVFAAGWAVLALAWAERLERAELHLEVQVRLQQRFSNLGPLAVDLMLRSVLGWNRGSVPAWEEDARRSIDTSLIAGSYMALPNAVFVATLARIERGAFAEAAHDLERFGFADALPDGPGFLWLQWARGRLSLARGDIEQALADLQAAADRDAGPWERTTTHVLADLAIALVAHGDRDQARQTAAQALADAEAWGTSIFTGVALRAMGLVEGGEAGIRALRQAVDALAASPGRLEHARALVDLGGALRRANHRSEARGPLREGMDLAVQCGAEALVQRARQDLLATGARPRRLVLSGADALTPTERRVAALAAEGLGNREIAQSLFVSHRTVEMHLSRAYRKLDITSRADLSRALAAGER